jgi:hypothetical protein
MYDKFYELAAKSGIDIHTKPFSKDQTEYFHGDRAEFLYEFAELIVKECADVAADHEALDIYEEIREHFGVE